MNSVLKGTTMSSLLSSTSSKKLVTKWKQEHQAIVASAGKVIQAYETDALDMLREEMDNLNGLTTDHLMDEDVEFYKFMMLEDSIGSELVKLIEDFIETFEETKSALMDFLIKYTDSDASYNQDFIDTFKTIVGVLAKRIAYEEKTLYKALQGI